MQVEPGPLLQPLLHLAMIMGVVVINNAMNIQIVEYILVNMLEKGEKFLVAMAIAALALRQYFPRVYIQGGKQRSRAVTNIVMGHFFHSAQSQR